MLTSDENLTLGFLGCGKIGLAVATGFATAGKNHKIIVSHRSIEKSSILKEKFPDIVTVLEDNAAIVEQSDVIFLGLLPGVAREVLPSINFKGKTVISMMAAVDYKETLELVPSASPEHVTRTVPLPSAARRVGPILLYPIPSNELKHSSVTVFNQVGNVIACRTEAEMLPLVSITGHISAFYELMNVTQQWAVGQNVQEQSAQLFIASFYSSLSNFALDNVQLQQSSEGSPVHEPFAEFAEEAATPGGLNARSLSGLRNTEHYSLVKNSLEDILKLLSPK